MLPELDEPDELGILLDIDVEVGCGGSKWNGCKSETSPARIKGIR